MSIRTITSRHNPLVRAFRELIATPDPTGARLLLDGAHLIHAAVEEHVALERVVVLTSRLAGDTEEGRLALTLQRQGVDVITADAQVFDAISPVRTPSGLVAIARREPLTMASMLARDSPLLMVTVGVQDPGNLGSLIRSAEAAGASGLIACGASASPFSWKALRGSMGSALRLPIVGALDSNIVLGALERARIRVIATTVNGGRDPDTIDWSGAVALLLGGEGSGLPDDLIDRCDQRVTIPMSPPVESLNVGVSGALLLYTARRRRQGGGLPRLKAPDLRDMR